MFIKTADAATALFNPRRIDYSSSVGKARRRGSPAAAPPRRSGPVALRAGPEQPPDFRRHQSPGDVTSKRLGPTRAV